MKNKDLTYYEALPYTIIVRREGDVFVARIQELQGCIAHGDTESGAIEVLRSVQRLWLEDAIESGDTIPEPELEEFLPSGKWLQRVPRRLHKDLVRLAHAEGVSLNQLVTAALSEFATAKSCSNVMLTYLDAAFEAHQARASHHQWWFDQPHLAQWIGTHAIVPTANFGQALERITLLFEPQAKSHWPAMMESRTVDQTTGSRDAGWGMEYAKAQ